MRNSCKLKIENRESLAAHMQPTTDTDYKQLFSQLIKKQMLILGPDITLAKVRNVTGLTVDMNGEVQKIEGDPQTMLQSLINQFVELSGMIVKKTMESILTSYPGMAGLAAGSMAMAATTSALSGGMQASTQPQNTDTPVIQTSTTDTSVQHSEVSKNTNVASSVEPPPITSVNFDTNEGVVKKDKPEDTGPHAFSSQEMEELNKALEELSKAPLSTETQPSQAGTSPVPSV